MNTSLGIPINADLLGVGIAASAMLLIGGIGYLNDRNNATARMFFLFAIATVVWNLTNFFQYQFRDPNIIILALRLNLFAAVWHAYFFFRLSYIFPRESAGIPPWIRYWLTCAAILISFFTLTPFVFTGIGAVAPVGQITQAVQGPGTLIFGAFAFGLLILGLAYLARSWRHEEDSTKRRQSLILLCAMAITSVLILLCNVILPLSFKTVSFLPLTGLFMLPFIALISYSIYRQKLFNVKAIAVQALAFVLCVLTFSEVIVTRDPATLIFRGALLTGIIIAGILLTRSVTKEIEQREEIERLSEQKSEFMTFASHQIRNPITAMRGYASLLADGTMGQLPPQAVEVVQRILIEGNDVLHLITEYLLKSKFELGKIQLQVQQFDLCTAVSLVADGYILDARQRGLQFIKDIDPAEHIVINADEMRVKELMGNLLDNAMKYTPSGSITVSVHRFGVHARIVVQDTGVGIAPETLPHLFVKFSRADAQKVNLLGAGIGLFLAKTLVDKMNGHIWAESGGKGKGSRFIIEFPIASKPNTVQPALNAAV